MKSLTVSLCLILALPLLGACSSQRQAPLGDSVRNLTARQVLNPDAGRENADRVLGDLDGQTGENVLAIHREHVAKPQEIKNEIQVNIGN